MLKLKKLLVGATSLFIAFAGSLSAQAKSLTSKTPHHHVSTLEYKQFLTKFEGKTNSPYKDKFGNWTVGIGHNLNAGGKQVEYKSHYTEKEINSFFEDDLSHCINIAKNNIWDFDSRPKNVKLIVVSLISKFGLYSSVCSIPCR